MKKIIIAALALAVSGFCGYTGNIVPNQVSVLEGCTDGTTAIAIQLPGFTYQFLVRSSQPIFNFSSSYSQQAVTDGKYLNLEYNTTTTYSYKYNGSCTTPTFNNVNSVTFVR
jgi:hypothetical protein